MLLASPSMRPVGDFRLVHAAASLPQHSCHLVWDRSVRFVAEKSAVFTAII